MYSDDGTSITITGLSTTAGSAVAIPSSINVKPVTSIADYAFLGCSGLTSVSIPSSVTSIGAYAFSDCSGLTSVLIPASVTSIGDSAFSGCTGLTSVTIPSSVTSIGSQAFLGCSGLASISVDVANPSYSSSNGVLFDKLQTTLIQCPGGKSGDYTIPSSVTSIGAYAFSDCSGLTSVSIPASVTSIGASAFYGCNGLTSVSSPAGVTSIGLSAFQGCTKLTSMSILCSVTSIGDSTFWGCSGLTSVSIPASVTSIGAYAFYGCSGLTSMSIPAGVISIGSGAFYGCSGLTSASFMGNAPTIGSQAFASVASSFTVYYLNSSLGFTSPTWQGYPAKVTLTQTITFGALSGKTFTNIPFTVSATASSGLSPTFTILSGPATISGNTVTLTGVGTVVVRASQAGNTNYAAATPVDQSFTVSNTALQNWRQQNFGTTANTGSAADTAVSNLDGLPNLLEYALGGTPTIANNAIAPKLGITVSSGVPYLTLTFTPQRSDITYAIETSGNITGAWTSIPLLGLFTVGQSYTYTDTVAVAAGVPRFIRLRVSGQ